MTEPLSRARTVELRDAIKEKYRGVAQKPGGHFPYPVGRASALSLGYESAWLDDVPRRVVDRFVGVGNPFRVRRPIPGESVLDLGCGCGMDVFVAARLVGPDGRAVGVDLTPEMIETAQQEAGDWPHGNAEFILGAVERLPFEDEAFDMVISNGALNLVPNKSAACSEAFRVLRAGGTFAVADLLVMESIPEDVLSNMDAWST